MLSQVELELETYDYGVDRMRNAIKRNEERGTADNNPYAQAVYRRFVLPLADSIQADVEKPRIGRSQAHVVLLRHTPDAGRTDKAGNIVPPDVQAREWYEAIAYVAVRATLRASMAGAAGRTVISSAGSSVYHEYLLTQFADAKPSLFYHLMHDMDRRLSTDERHRMTVMKMQGRKAGVEFKEWGTGEVTQVGAYIVDQLTLLGLVNVSIENVLTRSAGRSAQNTVVTVELTSDVRKLLDQITDFIAENTPVFLPCVEPPKDWVAVDDGGFHTDQMRRLHPWLIRSDCRGDLLSEDLPNERAAVNALQRVRWRINRRMMEAISAVATVHDMDEIVAQAETPKPRKPEWLTDSMTATTMNESQLREFRKWKREVAEWHTDLRLREGKSGRFYNAMRVARKFADYPAIYFVYNVDFRGRKYVKSDGVSPQGSDLQKALLEFADGKPLHTQDAKDWFCITGANRWGYDKASLKDRVAWVAEHHDQIMAFASDPVNNDEWKNADKPLQFLAWCMEYEQWQVFGDRFLSRIAVGMDGSCNGLQNFSAMLRDPLGGKATNLLPSPLPNDIYQMVADLLTKLLTESEEDESGYRTKWLDHGITRSLVKRSVMTLPYGSKQTSWAEFIITDYLNHGKFPELGKEHYGPAANFLSRLLKVAISDTVVAAAEAMKWLQQASGAILKQGYDRIKWITPSGFPVIQTYWETEMHRINTKLCGNAKLSFRSEVETSKASRHRNGIAPNFVHSLDASHLTLVVLRAKAAGIDAFAMIHDDYGTHAADTAELYRIIREVFVEMYTRHDVLEEFRAAYSFLPEPPAMGTLNLNEVLNSPYFFS